MRNWFSDQFGVGAATAVARGATIIEKHFTLKKMLIIYI